jgi:hypothetical protein
MNSNEIKDSILKYCIEKETHVSANEIFKNLLPNITEEEIEELFTEIRDHNKNIADVRISEYACLIIPDGRTKTFINNGGFVKIAELETEKELKLSEKESLEIDLAKSNLEANKLNQEVAERNAKSEKFNKRLSIFNFIFIILNFCILIWQIIKAE